MLKPLMFCSLLLVAPLSTAEVYQTTDENGNTAFTDRPSGDDQKKVDIQPVVTMPSIKVDANAFTPSPKAAKKAEEPWAKVVAPTAGETFQNPQDGVTIQVNRIPGNGYTLVLLLNGEQIPITSSYLLQDAIRGEYKVGCKLYNAQGKLVDECEEITFYVHRPRVGQIKANQLPLAQRYAEQARGRKLVLAGQQPAGKASEAKPADLKLGPLSVNIPFIGN